ncbi:MAG: hypothetical protein K0R12_1253 [Gammaproteobacteria bacterium]|nr:hypothetical protein [Gammaproteobacteria bacterium]
MKKSGVYSILRYPLIIVILFPISMSIAAPPSSSNKTSQSTPAAPTIDKHCVKTREACTQPVGTRIIDNIPVYKDCWQYSWFVSCPDWLHSTTDCDPDISNSCVKVDEERTSPTDKTTTYSCTLMKTENVCSDWETRSECSAGDYGQGNEVFIHDTWTVQQEAQQFKTAATYMGVLSEIDNAINDAIADGKTGPQFMIFPGDAMKCRHPMDMGPFNTDCCDKDLTRSGSFLSFNSCEAEELSLAAARRAERTVAIDDICSLHLMFGICRERRYMYCVFPSMLDRLIQEQGRAQLNAMAASSVSNSEHNSIVSNLNFMWFTGTSGKWNPIVVNEVSVAAWSWPLLDKSHVPVYVQETGPLAVFSGSSAYGQDMSVTLTCEEGNCHGRMTAEGGSQPIAFAPNCEGESPKTWVQEDSILEQSLCLNSGEQPEDWPIIVWDKDTPSLWQFNATGTSTQALNGTPEVHWQFRR